MERERWGERKGENGVKIRCVNPLSRRNFEDFCLVEVLECVGFPCGDSCGGSCGLSVCVLVRPPRVLGVTDVLVCEVPFGF